MTPKPESETDPWAKVRALRPNPYNHENYYVASEVDAAIATEAAQHQQKLIDQRVLGHGEGQEHTIADVNAGRIDEMIAPRLDALRAQHQQEIAAKDETIRQQAAQIEALKEIADEAFGVCICGCQLSEHENYGEDGEQCENEMHECIRTSKAAYAVVHTLRARLAAVEAERDHAMKCEANHMMADHERIEALKVERDRLKAALSKITALDFEKFNGRHNFYSGAVMFVKAWLLAYAALAPHQGQSTDGETR